MNDCSYERTKEKNKQKNKQIKGEAYYEKILQNRS